MAKFVKKDTKDIGPSAEPVEGGIAEIDFGVTPSAPAKRGSSKYPLIEGEKAEKLADHCIALGEKFDAVDGPFKAAKKELIEVGFPQFFEKNRGRVEAPSSMLAYGKKGGVRVTFKDKFTAGDRKSLYTLLTEIIAGKWFRQSWEIKIDGDLIPVKKAAELVADLKTVMAKHDASHALTIKSGIMPVPEFAAKRHFVFEPKTNLEINKIVPQQAAVSTKGVK
jgi:hypothetical protein